MQVVIPHESATHGYFAWGGTSRVLEMHQTEGYAEDAICLRTLDEDGRLLVYRFPGDHLRFTNDFWWESIIPHLSWPMPTVPFIAPRALQTIHV